MSILNLLLGILPLTASVSASFAGNLNYRSPSFSHPDLGISIRKVVKRNDPTTPFSPCDLQFTHGVASGDPYPESVILWTRVSPDNESSDSNVTVSGTAPLYDHENDDYVRISKSPICVDWRIAKDKDLKEVKDYGRVWTSSDIDYTVKVRIQSVFSVELPPT